MLKFMIKKQKTGVFYHIFQKVKRLFFSLELIALKIWQGLYVMGATYIMFL